MSCPVVEGDFVSLVIAGDVGEKSLCRSNSLTKRSFCLGVEAAPRASANVPATVARRKMGGVRIAVAGDIRRELL